MTGHNKHNRTSASPLRRLLKAFGLGNEHGRECARSEQRSRDNRRSEAGNVFFTLFGAVAIVGVLGAGIMSTMRGPLTTMVEVNRIEETKSMLRLNSRLVLRNATNGMGGACDDDDFTEAPDPTSCGVTPATSGGCLPGNVGATTTDPWGTPYAYCAWNHGIENAACGTNVLTGHNDTTHKAIALISAGSDREFQTTCADIYSDTYDGENGDDIALPVEYNDAAAIVGGGSNLWTAVGTTDAEINRNIDVAGVGQFGGNLNVTSATNSTFAAGASFGNDVVTTGSVITNSIESSSQESGTIDIDGTITAGTNGVLNINDAVDITGALTAGGATDLQGTLNVNGAISNDDTTNTEVTINDELIVTGAVDFDSTLNVDGSANFDGTITSNVDDIVNIDDALDITGATTMNSLVTINADGDSAGTDAFVVNNSTPSEIMALDEAGNLDIAGDLTAAGLKGDIVITGTTNDGSTNPLTINDSDDQEVFAVDSDGNVNLDGDLTIDGDNFSLGTVGDNGNGKIMIGQGAPNNNFAAQSVTGDVTLDSAGDIQIKAGAVELTNIENISGDLLLGYLGVSGPPQVITLGTGLSISGTTLNVNTSGGGGDGVGGGAFVELADTPTEYDSGGADADKLVVVSPTGNSLIFVDPATIATGEPDRIYDATEPTDTYIDVDTTNDGLTNSIVFYTAGTQHASLDANGVFRAGDTGADGHRIGRLGIDYFQDNSPSIRSVGGDTIYLGSDLEFESGTASITVRATLNDDLTFSHLRAGRDIIFSTNPTSGSFAEVLRISAEGNVGIGTLGAPDASALLDLASTARGFLPPRMTTAERNAINGGTFATGLLVFNTEAGDAGLFQFWDGDEWVDVGGGGAETGGLWAEDDAGGNYIEYSDTLGGMRVGRIAGQPAPAIDWTLDVANSVVYTDQNVGIGVSAMSNDAGANTNVMLDLAGDIAALEYCDTDGANCFTAAQIDTLVSGGASPTDRIEDTGNQDTYIDTDTTNDDTVNSIVFHTAGTEKMVILPNGNVGIGKSDPNDILTILGGKVVIRETDDELDAVHLGAGTTTGYLTLRNAGTDAVYITSANTIDSYFNAGNVIFGGTTADASARVQIDSTSQGFLPPRMSETDRNGITSPATGLLIFSTTAGTFQFNAGTPGAPNWIDVGASAASLWDDLEGGRIHYGDDNTAQVGIGTDNPLTALDVNGGIRVGSVSAPAPTYLALNSLSNVDSAPADGQCLIYSNGSGNWVAGDCDAAGNTAEWTDDGAGNIYNADDGSVGIGTNATPDASAKFEIASTTQGFLPPRLADPTTITNPATGLLAYNTTDDTYQYNAGTPGAPNWVSFSSTAGSAGSLQDSTTPTPDTTIQVDTAGDGTANTTVFTNNGAESMRITAGGNVGIATASPSSELDVEGTIRAGTSLRLGMIAGDAPTYTGQTLGSLSDVDLSTINTNDVLSWDGTNWIAAAAGAGGGGNWTLSGTNLYTNPGGIVAINSTDFTDPYTFSSPGFKFVGLDDADDVWLMRFDDSSTTKTDLGFFKARGTEASPTILNDGDLMGELRWVGYDGDEFMIGASIYGVTNGTVANNAMPTDIVFQTFDTSKEERMRIMSNGYVGIGTDDPATGLHLNRSGAGDSVLTISADATNTEENDNPWIRFAQDGGGSEGFIGLAGGTNTFDGTITGHESNALLLHSKSSNSYIQFATNDAVRMTLSDVGDVGIGTSAPADELHVYDPVGKAKIVVEGVNSDQSLIDFITSGDGASHMDDGSGALGFQLFTYNSAHANTDNRGDFSISSNQGGWKTYLYMDSVTESMGVFNDDPDAALDVIGDIEYTGTITDVSDRRLKTDITPLSAQDMIARLAAVDTYTFRMKDDETGRIEYGVMAQELEEIFPELVKTADDEMGTKSVNYTGLIAPIIEATKVLKSENDALKAELSAVKEQQSLVLAKLETMQSDISGMKVHTGYGIEKGTALAMLLLLLSLGGITGAFLVRKQTQVKINP